jgi:PEP-CTERM motif
MPSAAGFRSIPLGVSLLVAAQCGGVAAASTIDIWSAPNYGSNNKTGTNVSVVSPPAWATSSNANDYEWISYGDTGCNSSTINPCTPGPNNPPATTVGGTPTAIFYQTFTLTTASSGTLDVWADDTASVWLDTGTVTFGTGSGGTLLDPANAILGPNCANHVNNTVGCTQNNDGVIPLSLSAGTYTLVIDAYQLIGGSPFGVMYDGVLASGNSPNAPEPASYMLMALGLGGLGAFIRHRKRT